MLLRSLTEAVSCRQPAVGLILSASKDLVCNNLFCEKVTQPCVCRLDKILMMKNVQSIKFLDLSNNKLPNLPPSLSNLTQLEELNLSGNMLIEVPEFVWTLPSLKKIDLSCNPGVKRPVLSTKYDIILS